MEISIKFLIFGHNSLSSGRYKLIKSPHVTDPLDTCAVTEYVKISGKEGNINFGINFAFLYSLFKEKWTQKKQK